MAIFWWDHKVVSRKKGHRMLLAAAYRCGEALVDSKGEVYTYERKENVIESFILTPQGTPEWAKDRVKLWESVEDYERRSDARLGREIIIALPHEVSEEERKRLVVAYCKKNFNSIGMIADVSIHDQDRNNKNHHAHILLTDRRVEGDSFARDKDRGWNNVKVFERWRKNWEILLNESLDLHGIERVSCEKKVKEPSIQIPLELHHQVKSERVPQEGVVRKVVTQIVEQDVASQPAKSANQRISRDRIERVKSLDLVQYLREDGWTVNKKKASRTSVPLKRGGEHAVVSRDGKTYVFFIVGGKIRGTLIEYVMGTKGLSFRDAIEEIERWQPDGKGYFQIISMKRDAKCFKKTWFRLPELNESALLEKRGIPKAVYSAQIFRKCLREKDGQVYLLHHYGAPGDEPGDMFSGIQGVGYRKKMFFFNSRRGLWHSDRNEKTKVLVIGESAFDAIAYGIYRGLPFDGTVQFAALSGAVSPLQYALMRKIGKQAKESYPGGIILAMDSDKAGRYIAETCKDEIVAESGDVPVHIDLPFVDGWDWNDMLLKGPQAYIRQQTQKNPPYVPAGMSKAFGMLSKDQKGGVAAGIKQDAIFLFKKDEETLREMVQHAKERGWGAISIYGHTHIANTLTKIAKQEGLRVEFETVSARNLEMKLDSRDGLSA